VNRKNHWSLSGYLIQSAQDFRRLHRMAARTCLEVEVRFRDAKLVKKYIRHLRVVVLSGMNENLHHTVTPGEGGHHRRDLHEVGTSPDNVEYLHSDSPVPHKEIAPDCLCYHPDLLRQDQLHGGIFYLGRGKTPTYADLGISQR
jgi:hypothetical protein